MLIATLFATVATVAVVTLTSCAPSDSLEQGFKDPPQSARPRVWWHWLSGNITKEGIAKDLAWMESAGIGGVQNFDADLNLPQIVDKRLVFMTPEWQEAFRYAVELADKADLEFAIPASPGWSETGGPWVKPPDAMKKLVWSETFVRGGKPVQTKLAAPPSVMGPFQAVALIDALASGRAGESGAPTTSPYYADIAVLAYPEAIETKTAVPRMTDGQGKTVDPTTLIDSDPQSALVIDPGSAELPASVVLSYAAPVTMRSCTFYIPHAIPPFGDPAFVPTLEVREGAKWREIAVIPLTEVPTTVSFAPATAREFRVVLRPNTIAPRDDSAGVPGVVPINLFPPPPPGTKIRIAELRLSAAAKVHHFEAKAGFAIARDYYALNATLKSDDNAIDSAQVVNPAQVIDLTNRMQPDGSLEWTPPAGNWRILRLGYSLTGKTNHPATPEATGFEVDKYDAAAVRRHLESYLKLYRDAAGSEHMGTKGVRALLTDSIEVGASNWTPQLLDHFKRLRGYELKSWLPALTGTVIGSREQSDAFLYDFRRTLADLLATEHYGTVAQVAHENKLIVYGEALENGRPSLGDDMAMRAYSDVPMAALWTYSRNGAPRTTLLGDMKGAASVAHLYGQNIVAAESLTALSAPWSHSPADLRPMIDLEFAYGINRPVLHSSVHQPNDKVPGLTLAIFGHYFNRHESWASMARPWFDYIARTSFLLQQGHNVADVAYFYGEEQPLTALYAQAPLADTPTRHAYDFVNSDVLLNLLSVENGSLVVENRVRYRLLYLGGTSEYMTLPVLRRIAELADAGATIVGTAPKGSPGLMDDKQEFAALVHRLWPGPAETSIGKGRVIASRNVDAALSAIALKPSFNYDKLQNDSPMLFVHRQLSDGELFFVSNRTHRPASIQARFRIAGKQPELWHADSGATEPASYRIENGETIVPLEFGADESVFVVFRKSTTKQQMDVAKRKYTSVAEVTGPWNISFQEGRGAPANTLFTILHPFGEDADAGIKYFSGIATYTLQFDLPKEMQPGSPLMLDLGNVGDVAELRVNGTMVGTAWKSPYRFDISRAAKSGSNTLDVRVANLWANRLIGDAQPNAKKIAFTFIPTYLPNAPLRPAGLMGPVRLLSATTDAR